MKRAAFTCASQQTGMVSRPTRKPSHCRNTLGVVQFQRLISQVLHDPRVALLEKKQGRVGLAVDRDANSMVTRPIFNSRFPDIVTQGIVVDVISKLAIEQIWPPRDR